MTLEAKELNASVLELVEAVLEKHTDAVLEGFQEKFKEMRATISRQRARIEELEAQLSASTGQAEPARKPRPTCYAVHQVTDDDGVEEWVDVFTSPDTAKEFAQSCRKRWPKDVFEVVPLYTSAWAAKRPLTEAQIQEVWCSAKTEGGNHGPFWFARAIERELGVLS